MIAEACGWCGERHPVDRLCRRGMTRRSFCFLFGTGMVATALGVRPSPSPDVEWVWVTEEFVEDAAIDLSKAAFTREAVLRIFHIPAHLLESPR